MMHVVWFTYLLGKLSHKEGHCLPAEQSRFHGQKLALLSQNGKKKSSKEMNAKKYDLKRQNNV